MEARGGDAVTLPSVTAASDTVCPGSGSPWLLLHEWKRLFLFKNRFPPTFCLTHPLSGIFLFCHFAFHSFIVSCGLKGTLEIIESRFVVL